MLRTQANKREWDPTTKTKKSKWIPVCLNPPCKKKGKRHFMKDCDECDEDEKKELLEE